MASAVDSPVDCRCHCGALLARRCDDGVELKCRRCRRHWRIDLRDLSWREAHLPQEREEAVS